MKTTYEVLGLGSAIVDVLVHVEDSFLSRHDMQKGSMQLVDEAFTQTLYSEFNQRVECSGGSVANTLAGLASLGAKTAFIGKVCDDQLGEIFAHDMRNVGVHFASAVVESPATANCLICVTADGERTMSTFLGAATQMAESDMDEALIAASGIVYIEGYQWDMPGAKIAIKKAITVAKKYQRKVALTLSDTFCVNRFREEFLDLVQNDVDILFANESELAALTHENDFDAAAKKLQGLVREVAAITRSDKGAVIITPRDISVIGGERVSKVIDTTGAGDLFAAGFLFGYAKSYAHEKSAALGNVCAARIITQLGARCRDSLQTLIAA